MVLEFTGEGEVFLREMEMMTSADVEGSIIFQFVSIVVDAVFLVRNFKSIMVSRATLKDILKTIQNSPSMQKPFQAFFTAWKEPGSCKMRRAYAFLCLLWQCSADEILWTWIKRWYEQRSMTDCCQVCLSLGTLFVPPALALRVNTFLFAHDLYGIAGNIKKMFT